jgi:alpha-L-arabinofuranosidase
MHRRSMVLSAVVMLIASVPAWAQSTSTMLIHTTQQGVKISPNLYGVFFEEINHAGEGGLYAELVRNRTFKEINRDGPAGWSLVTNGSGATLTLDDSKPLNAENPKAARIDIPEDGNHRLPPVAIENGGYWGIGVKKNALYHLSFYARCSSDFDGALTASLIGHDDQVLAKAEAGTPDGEWKKFTVDLTASADDATARLSISANAVGSIWFNVVSLFPDDTFKHRPNGLRKDLAEMVEALHPAFMRFPGGCYVEGGDYTANAFRWKKTVGDIAHRPGHADAIWGYWSTDGLGYLEYLQLCEDIHATPLFVVNVGMAHREAVAMEKMDSFVQEALDGIEYANGAISTKYGAMRAADGHPKPFGLKYVEIGNENGWGRWYNDYNQRYKLMYDAIKARYPEIQTIATTRIGEPMDMIDDHVYQAPGWFWGNIHQYDNTPRNQKPDIYVGEYADTKDCGHGNLRAALAEAAYMTGFERNSEVVKMSSYAPMFVQTNDRKWNPDAMIFDSSRSFGTPSYWVQALYAQNRPDAVVPMDLQVDAPVGTPVSKGTIGVGTWNAQAEYRDIQVDGKPVTGGEWKPLGGDWSNQNGVISQTGGGEDRRDVLSLPALSDASDYTVTLKARKTGGDEGFLVLFHNTDEQNYFWWNIGGWGNTGTAVEKAVNGQKSELGTRGKSHIETGRWYDLKIEVKASHIRCFIDGKLVQDTSEIPAPRFTAIAGRRGKDLILKVVNGTAVANTTLLKLDSEVQPTGQAITLSSEDDGNENTFEEPMKIAPVPTTVERVSKNFSYTFPAHSLTIMTVKLSS